MFGCPSARLLSKRLDRFLDLPSPDVECLLARRNAPGRSKGLLKAYGGGKRVGPRLSLAGRHADGGTLHVALQVR